MINIVKGRIQDSELLAKISKQAFLDSHGNSANKSEIDTYIAENFSIERFEKELIDPNIDYRIIFCKSKEAGYSKIVLNKDNEAVEKSNNTKLDRLYLLKEFYGQNLGSKLMGFNIESSKNSGQNGMWLFVWIENQRAINFYTKIGFKIVGSYDFKISETHSNPNHIMYLSY
ncbi:ribosomal protein S18 acetylase RimI-like enzyme [Saonia flava]|uniref:Ribosomal protein S18 acetylase RimI-like enzyme n=1 Tax=Saonia flava TaxID=523696 RepID=A0A846QZP2_9FLAO|nr:GNAT family N-acetyltransferase [Saonia flava]NJB72667.1 ribosomal protein S18 acetylase RimI-like enzyme [Saonia flava]